MKTQINYHGAIAVVLILLMISIRYSILNPEIFEGLDRIIRTFLDPYVLVSIILYAAIIGWYSRNEASRRFVQRYRTSDRQFNILRLLIGAHISFAILALGLLLEDFSGYFFLGRKLIYIFIALAIGIVVPFLLVTRGDRDDDTFSSS